MVGLLIGLLLSLLSTVGAMTLFRAVVQNSVGAQADAAQDSVLSSALLSTQLEIQKAGYGIEDAASNCAGVAFASPSAAVNTDLVLYADASVDGSAVAGTPVSIDATQRAGNGLFWRWREAGTDRCGGVVAEQGGLRALRSDDCPGLASIATIDWEVLPLIPDARLSEDDAVRFAAQSGSCWPFGKSAPETGVLVTLSAGNSTEGLGTQYETCLPNICR
jgi:hypothetical protein